MAPPNSKLHPLAAEFLAPGGSDAVEYVEFESSVYEFFRVALVETRHERELSDMVTPLEWLEARDGLWPREHLKLCRDLIRRTREMPDGRFADIIARSNVEEGT